MSKTLFVLISASVLLYGFGRKNQIETKMIGDSNMVKAAATAIEITSSAFKEGEMIPSKYTCEGENISPPLKWGDVPSGTKSIALISDDPDAPMGTWVHWVMWNIPATKQELAENIPQVNELPDGVKQGINSNKKFGYTGPCPPSGTHRYYFKLYMLDTKVQLSGDVTKQQLLDAIEGHVLGEGSLMGKYQRK